MKLQMTQQQETGTLSLFVLVAIVAMLMGIEAKSNVHTPAAGQVIEAASLTSR